VVHFVSNQDVEKWHCLGSAAGLMPTVLLGTAVGAAVVYGIDEGDPMAVQKKVLPKVRAPGLTQVM
jgi:hypothetical protein